MASCSVRVPSAGSCPLTVQQPDLRRCRRHARHDCQERVPLRDWRQHAPRRKKTLSNSVGTALSGAHLVRLQRSGGPQERLHLRAVVRGRLHLHLLDAGRQGFELNPAPAHGASSGRLPFSSRKGVSLCVDSNSGPASSLCARRRTAFASWPDGMPVAFASSWWRHSGNEVTARCDMEVWHCKVE